MSTTQHIFSIKTDRSRHVEIIKIVQLQIMRTLFFVFFLTLISIYSFGQAVGDYRSNAATMNWSTDASWQICTSITPVTWATVTTEGYPGELGVSGTVTIQSGHSITLDVSPANSIASLTFVSNAANSLLSFSGTNTLSVTGNITLTDPSAGSVIQTISVADGTLSCAALSMANCTNATETNTLSLEDGTINISGNLTTNGAANENFVTVTGTGTINIGGNFTGGTFACGTGTINFNGSVAQNVGAFTYYHLKISGSNTKTLQGTTSVTGNFTIDGGTLELNTRAFSVTGTSSISGVLNDNSNTGANSFTGNVTVNPGGQWLTTTETTITEMIFRGGITNNGTFSAGAAQFDTNSQTIDGSGASSFANDVRIEGDITLSNDVSHASGLRIDGNLNGNGGTGAATFKNNDNRTFDYRGTNSPMTTYFFDVDQTGNTVIYNRNTAQTVKITDYYNLSIANGNTKTLASNSTFHIYNNLTVATGTTLQAVNVNGEGVLTIDGLISNDGTINFRRSGLQYMDVLMTGSGNLITGAGATTAFANLTLNNIAAKTFDITGSVNFYGGNSASRTNVFQNDGGAFSTTVSTLYFIDAASFRLNGTGSVEFYNLTVGNNGNTEVILDKNVVVNNNFVINLSNVLTAHLDLNGFDLLLYGNYTRSNSGDFRGNATSELILGNSDAAIVSGSLVFEASYQMLDNLTINAPLTTYNLGSDLTVANFASLAGTFQNDNADRTFTVNNDITIASGFTLRSNQAVTANRIFTVRTTGSFTNNGTVDLYHFTGTFHSMGELQFNGATDVTLGGTSTSEIGRIRVDKGTGQAAIVDVISPITLYNADATYNQNIILTNGTLKISSASTLLPYYGDRTIFTNTGRLWLNNASASIGWNSLFGFCNFSGTLKIDQGTFTMGDGNDYFQIDNSGVLDMTGGVLNIFGRLTLNTGVAPTNATFTMTGGEIKVDPQHTFNIPNNLQIVTFSSNSVVNFTGGTLTVVDPLFDRQDLNQNSIEITGYAGAKNFVGSTFQFGDGISVSDGDAGFPGFCIWTPSAVQLGNVILNNPGGASRQFVNRTGVDIYCNNLTITTPNDQYITSGRILDVKGNLINNGVLNASSVGSHLRFTGSNAQAFSGTGSITATIPTLTFNNTSATGVTLNAPLGATTVNLTDGNVYTTSANLLTVYGTSPTTSLVGGGVNSFIVGPIRRTIAPGASSDYIFPVGEGTNYRSFEMIGTVTGGSGTGYITAEAIVGSTGGTGGIGIVSSLNAENTYWEVQNALNTVSLTSVNNIQLTYTKPPTPTKTIGQSNTGLTGVYNPIGGTQTGGYVASDPGKYSLTGINPNGTTYLVIAEETPDNTWYSLISGDWDSWETWTLDPAGALPINPDHRTPSTSPTSTLDDVVIINGKTVTINSDTKINDIITVNGRLDINTTTGHAFNKIRGNGRILLQGDNFPAGDATHFVTEGQGEGTVVYQTKSGLTTYDLATARTFYNVEVELFQNTDIITQLADYTINGSLTINKGVFQINDNTSSTILNLTVAKDVLVGGNGSITVGTGNTIGTYVIPTSVPTYFHSIFHQFIVSGNFTNNGIVKLTNLTAPDYNSFATNGAVTLTMQGATNNSLTLNNTSWLYNLIIDKGVDKTYILDLYSASTSHFVLFGPNSVGRDAPAGYSASNPQVRKALFVKNGTLKLTGSILIPSLSEGSEVGGNGDYAIGQNARFWIAGANVTVYSTASNVSQITGFPSADGVNTGSSNQAMSVYGEFKITNGFFGTRNSAGFIFWAAADAQVKIEGGVSDVAQFRAGGGAGVASYIQTGGQLIVRGNTTEAGEVSGGYPIFGFDDATGVFNMSGGEILIRDNTGAADGDFYLPCAVGNYSVTGGKVTLELPQAFNFRLMSLPNLWNLEAKLLSGSTITNIQLDTTLKVSNDLILRPNINLIAASSATDVNDVYIGGSMIIESGATYDPIFNATTYNTTYFNQTDASSAIDTLYWDNAAHTELELGNFVLDRNHGNQLRLISSAARGNGDITVDVNGDASVLSGTFCQNRFTFRIWGDITNYDRMGTWFPNGSGSYPTATGTPSAAQVRFREDPPVIIRTDNDAVFGNLRFNVATSSQVELTSNVYIERMQFLRGNVYLKSFNLKIDEIYDIDDNNFQDITTSSLLNIGATGITGNNIFYSDGKASDGGLTLKVTSNTLNESTANRRNSRGPISFLIGFTTDGGTTIYKRPAQLKVKNFVDDGYVTIRVAKGALQTTNLTGGEILQHSWRINYSDFSTLPTVAYRFYYYNQLGVANVDLPTGAVNELTYVPGKVQDEGSYLRSYESNPTPDITDVNEISNIRTITFNGTSTASDFDQASFTGFALEKSNYTCGVPTRFTGSPRIFYTRTRGDGFPIKWNNGSNWTFAPTDLDLNGQVDPYEYHDRNQPAAGTWPVAGDIAVIGWIPWGDGTGTGDLADGAPHGICADNIVVQCAVLRFNQMLDASGNPTARFYSRNFQFRPTLVINSGGGGINAGTITGEGMFWIRSDGAGAGNKADPSFAGIDIGDFVRNDSSYFVYESTSNAFIYNNIPAEVPNLLISGNGWGSIDRDFTISTDLSVRQNFELLGDVNLVLSSGATGNISVGKNLRVFRSTASGNDSGGDGEIAFPNNASRTVEVFGNVELINSNAILRVRTPDAAGTPSNLIVHGNLLQNNTTNGGFQLYTAAGQDYIYLTLKGSGNHNYTVSSGTTGNFYNLTLDKGTDQTNSFTLNSNCTINGPTSGVGVSKAITLKNGKLVLNNSSLNLNLTTGNDNFVIPASAAIEIRQGRANATGNSGIFLNGLLEITGGNLDMSGGNNYIEYTSDGNSTINITSGSLTVGSQIRRQTTTEEGILKFTQTGGTVILSQFSAPQNNRGVLEILNAGSSFTQAAGAKIIIANAQTAATFPAVYLAPETYSLGLGSEIQFGNTDTKASQTIGLYSNIPLQNISTNEASALSPKVKVKIWYQDITFNENVSIAANTELNSDGWDITVKGNWTNNGTYTAAGNITYFSGSTTQEITGVTTFYDFKKTASNTININNDITVLNEFHLLNGTLADRGNEIMVYGNLFNNGTHDWGNAGNGISILGTQQQVLESTGTWGKISINNPNGVLVNTTSASILIDDAVNLIAGVFDIGKNLLVMKQNAVFIPGNPFSENNMIQPNLSFTDNGIKKYFLSSFSGILTFPIGSQSKYTPVIMDITSTGAGSIRVKAANEMHPTIMEDTESCPDNIVDQSNVLKYHWTLDAKDGLSGFNADVSMKYYSSDAGVVAPYTLADYLTAKLILGTTSWNKYSYDDFDEANNLLLFNFTNADATSMNGDYTAGVEAACGGAIPDIIPAYISMATGDWTEIMNWAVCDPITYVPLSAAGVNIPTGGPRGAIAIIDTPHRIDMNQNYLSNYKTTINGILDAGLSFGQRLGVVDGTGELYVERGDLPAAIYDGFILPNTGTFNFGGTTNYDILSEFPQINNLKVSGTGERRLPNIDLTMVGTLVIDGADNTLLLKNEHNQKIEVQKNITFNAGTFDAGTGLNAIFVIGGNTAQTISGTGSFTSSNAFNHFVMNNPAGLTLQRPVEIDQTLTFTDGIIQTDATNILTLNSTSETIVTGAGNTRYVDGPIRKNVLNNGDFVFPLGDNGRYGSLSIYNTTNAAAAFWEAEYFNTGFSSSSVTGSLVAVSTDEYWRIDNPAAGNAAEVKLRWDPNSNITPITTGNINAIVVAEYNGSDWVSKVSDTPVGNDYNGTVKTTAAINTDPVYYTLGSTVIILAQAYFTTLDDVCDGLSIPISFSGVDVGDLNFTLSYSVDGVDQADVNVTSLIFSLPTSGAGDYQLNGFTFNGGTPGGFNTSTVTVNLSPAQPTITPVDGDPSLTFCEGGSVILTSSVAPVGGSYLWSTTETNQNINVNTTGNYSVQVINATGCFSPASAVKVVTVNPLPVFIPSAVPGTICFGESSQLDANYGGVGATYLWNPIAELDDETIETPVYTPATNPTTPTQITKSFTVTVTDSNGCVDSGLVNVIVNRRPETGPQYHISNTWP